MKMIKNKKEKERQDQILDDFKNWLLKGHRKNTAESILSRLKRISGDYDVFKEYSADRCEGIIDSLTYTSPKQGEVYEPRCNVEIHGDYQKGLRSLKSAVVLFVKYLDEIEYQNGCATKKGKTWFVGTFEDFNAYIGPKCRNVVQSISKKDRKAQNVCEYCGRKVPLQSAHKVERPKIIKEILDKYFKDKECAGRYKVDLDEFISLFKQAHYPISDNFFFLCKDCHHALDVTHTITANVIMKKRKSKP